MHLFLICFFPIFLICVIFADNDCVVQSSSTLRDCQLGTGRCNFCLTEKGTVEEMRTIEKQLYVEEILTAISTTITILGFVISVIAWAIYRCYKFRMTTAESPLILVE